MARALKHTLQMTSLAAALVATTPTPVQAGPKNQDGRPEALIFATTFGFYEGVAATWLLAEHDILPDGEDIIGWGSLLTLTTTGGTFALANHVTKKYGVNEAEGSMFNSSLFWAVLNGVGGTVAADADADTMLWSTLVSGWTGQAVGILLAANVDRTPGQVGLMNTTSTWVGGETLVILGAAGADKGYSLVGTLAVDAGLGLGILLSQPGMLGRGISAERTRLLDLGALCGGLAGPAALFMVWGPEDHLREWYLGAVAVGIPAGLAMTWHLTRHYDRDTSKSATGGTGQALMVPLAGGVF